MSAHSQNLIEAAEHLADLEAERDYILEERRRLLEHNSVLAEKHDALVKEHAALRAKLGG